MCSQQRGILHFTPLKRAKQLDQVRYLQNRRQITIGIFVLLPQTAVANDAAQAVGGEPLNNRPYTCVLELVPFAVTEH
jgi:hypothetical protein